MKPKHVLFVGSLLPEAELRSANLQAWLLSQALVLRGIRSTFLFPGAVHFIGPDGKVAARSFRSPKAASVKYFGAVYAAIATAIFCIRNHVTIVYADDWWFFRNSWRTGFLVQLLLQVLGLRFVWDLRDPRFDDLVVRGKMQEGSLRHKLLVGRYALSYRIANLVVVHSPEYLGVLAGLGISRSRLQVVYLGFDSTVFKPRERDEGFRSRVAGEDKFVVGYFGTLLAVKHTKDILLELIENMPHLIQNVYFVVGGKGSLKGTQLEMPVRNNHLNFIGRLPYRELPAYLSACDVLLCPTDTRFRIGGFSLSLKVSEALSVGRPIITSRTRAMQNQFQNDSGVVLVDDSLEGFVNALLQVNRNYASFRKAAESGVAAAQKYSAQRIVSRLADRLETLG